MPRSLEAPTLHNSKGGAPCGIDELQVELAKWYHPAAMAANYGEYECRERWATAKTLSLTDVQRPSIPARKLFRIAALAHLDRTDPF